MARNQLWDYGKTSPEDRNTPKQELHDIRRSAGKYISFLKESITKVIGLTKVVQEVEVER